MSGPETITEAELLSWLMHEHGGDVVAAYRAGFRDGSKPPAQDIRVYREGGPEPEDDVSLVVDADGMVWMRGDLGWGIGGPGNQRWADIAARFGPMVAGIPDPMLAYNAATAADEQRRAAEQAAGGAQ